MSNPADQYGGDFAVHLPQHALQRHPHFPHPPVSIARTGQPLIIQVNESFAQDLVLNGGDAVVQFGNDSLTAATFDATRGFKVRAPGRTVAIPAGTQRAAVLALTRPFTVSLRDHVAGVTFGGDQQVLDWPSRASSAGYSLKLALPILFTATRVPPFTLFVAFRPEGTVIGSGNTSCVAGLYKAASGAGTNQPRAELRVNSGNQIAANCANAAGTNQNAIDPTAMLANAWQIAALVYQSTGAVRLLHWAEGSASAFFGTSGGTVNIDQTLPYLMLGLEPTGALPFEGPQLYVGLADYEVTGVEFRNLCLQANPRQAPFELWPFSGRMRAWIPVQAGAPLRDWISGRDLTFTAGASAANMAAAVPPARPDPLVVQLPNRLRQADAVSRINYTETSTGAQTLSEERLGMRLADAQHAVQIDTGLAPDPAVQHADLAAGAGGLFGCGGGPVKLAVRNASGNPADVGELNSCAVTFELPNYAASLPSSAVSFATQVPITYQTATQRSSNLRFTFPTAQANFHGGVVYGHHGKGGTRLDYTPYAWLLARAGYFVIQPDYPDSPLDQNTGDTTYWYERIQEAAELVVRVQSLLDVAYSGASATWIGTFGHSFGANTALGMIGLLVNGHPQIVSTPVKGAFLLSSQGEDGTTAGQDAWSDLRAPIFVATGTDDGDEDEGHGYEWRLTPFEEATVERYKSVLLHGDHGHGESTQAVNPDLLPNWQHYVIATDQMLAFFQHLRGDEHATQWIRNGLWQQYHPGVIAAYEARP